jgi:Schlafen, AlbA_2
VYGLLAAVATLFLLLAAVHYLAAGGGHRKRDATRRWQGQTCGVHHLFTAPVDEVTADLLRGFLAKQIREGRIVEYKKMVTNEVVEVIASYANTFGGLILVGVETRAAPDKDLPGTVPGVKPNQKEALVNKIHELLDPPWWCPEVIQVPWGSTGNVVLVVRVDAATAPRPVMYQGYFPVRMDGRKAKADRRLAKLLLDDQRPPTDPGLARPGMVPTTHLSPFHNAVIPVDAAPQLVVRLATTLPLWPTARARVLKREVTDAVIRTLRQSALHSDMDFHRFLEAAHMDPYMQGGTTPAVIEWDIDRRHATSVHQCITFGTGTAQQPARPGMRANCTLVHHGDRVDIVLDVLFWLHPDLIPSTSDDHPDPDTGPAPRSIPLTPLLIAGALAGQIKVMYQGLLPTLARRLIGPNAGYPSPAVEYHLCAGTASDGMSPLTIDQVMDFADLGERTGLQPYLQFYSGFLGEEAMPEITAIEVIEKIMMDCGYLGPFALHEAHA